MKQVIQHDLDMPTAKRVVDRAFAEYQSRYPEYQPSLRWVSDQQADVAFNAKGIKLGGTMALAQGTIALELDVPFLFRPFQKKALEVIDREVRVWLEKARSGDFRSGMLFVAPAGTELLGTLPSGSVFQVARVRDDGARAGAPAIAVCKRLLPRVRGEPAARAAIVREAMALGRARHPALPELRRVGSDAHGPFLIEGHVEGASLRAVIEGWRARGERVPPRLVAHFAHAAAEALAAVHALADELGPLGFSHGDLGPDHVILSPFGAARFVDFGAARLAGMDAALETADRGTLPFSAPEVARGEVAPGQAADVYALAATIVFLAGSGEPLVAARDDAAMLLEIGEKGLPQDLCERAAALSPAARDALRRALAPDPRARLGGARELRRALS